MVKSYAFLNVIELLIKINYHSEREWVIDQQNYTKQYKDVIIHLAMTVYVCVSLL